MGTPLDETNGPPPSPGRGGDKRWRLGMGWCFYALRNGEQAKEFLSVPLPKHREVGTGPETPSLEFPKPVDQIGYTHAKSLCELEFFTSFGIAGVG